MHKINGLNYLFKQIVVVNNNVEDDLSVSIDGKLPEIQIAFEMRSHN